MVVFENAVSLWNEAISYETLWAWKKGSLKEVAAMFASHHRLPSEVLRDAMRRTTNPAELEDIRADVEQLLGSLRGVSIAVRRSFQFPFDRLQAMKNPVEFFYYRGDLNLVETRCVSVVGARSASDEGKRRAARIARELVSAGFTVVSGLAAGIDTAAMQAAIKAGGRTIGVVGTTITESYPKDNRELQETVAMDHLLISQIPFYWYKCEPFRLKRRYFPERNETMSALSEATVIVEASEKSGSLTQAHACLKQGRKLFILDSCFHRTDIDWPRSFEKHGAIRVRNLEDILHQLPPPPQESEPE